MNPGGPPQKKCSGPFAFDDVGLKDADTVPISPPVDLDKLTAIAAADALFARMFERGILGAVVAPDGVSHSVTMERGDKTERLERLPAALGDAVVARVAIVCGLDLLTSTEQVARLKVKQGGTVMPLVVVIRPTPRGLAAELRCLADAQSTGAVKSAAGDPSTISRIGVYRVMGEIGRGGTGAVYRARHEALDRIVAIKVLFADVACEPEIAARFVREGRAAARVRDRGIVDVLDFGTLPDGRSFLVMEHISEATLAQVLDEGAMQPIRAVKLARAMASALSAAHKGGVVHRDLKPANVFVMPGDGVKLVDFGAAQLVDAGTGPATTQQGMVFGTPYYMSPEHARGHATDARTDIYALGCVLYEMLSGKVPFDGESAIDVLTKQIVAVAPEPECPHGPLPEALHRVVARALAKRPDERFQTADDMIAELDRGASMLARGGWRRWLPQ